MLQGPAIAGAPQDPISVQIGELRAKANDLKLKVSDLEVRNGQLSMQRARLGADVNPAAVDKQLADARHELSATQIQLEATNQQIAELQSQRDMERAFSLQQPPGPPATIATAVVPNPFLTRDQISALGVGTFFLMFPLVLVLARRLWVRSVPRAALDLEESPRLQRIEQAIESIALEVERIGEAQRFTTKLLADRQPDAVARMAAIPRREPGTITPH